MDNWPNCIAVEAFLMSPFWVVESPYLRVEHLKDGPFETRVCPSHTADPKLEPYPTKVCLN